MPSACPRCRERTRPCSPRWSRNWPRRESSDIVVFGGGVIPDADVPALTEAGIAVIFTPGASLDEITRWVAENIQGKV